jgi:hypothetical protein
MNVSSNDGGVEHQPLQIGLLLPDAPLSPAIEPLKDTVGLAESFRITRPPRQHVLHTFPLLV